MLGLRRDQDARPRRQARPDVAPHRLLERTNGGPGGTVPSPLRHCGVRIEQMPWARTHSRFTHAFEAEVLRRAGDCSISGVSRQLGLHWTSLMRLIELRVEESAARQFGRGKRKYLTHRLGITTAHPWSGSPKAGSATH